MTHAIITGVSSGFGRLLAEKLLDRGASVVGTTRRADTVDDLALRHPGTFTELRLDLIDTARIHPVVDEAVERLGSLDVLVSNAGYGLFGAAEEATDAQIDRQVATNLLGPIHLIRATLPHLRANGGGRILQLSSVAGQTAYPGAPYYHATKWGVEAFCESLAGEVAPFGIGVTIVEPGSARTSFASTGKEWAPRLDAYDITPVAAVRRMLEGTGYVAPGDPALMADAMLATLDDAEPPLRLALGSDSWAAMTTALESRLAALRAQHSLAVSIDAPA